MTRARRRKDVCWAYFYSIPGRRTRFLAAFVDKEEARASADWGSPESKVGPIFKITGPVTARRAVGKSK